MLESGCHEIYSKQAVYIQAQGHPDLDNTQMQAVVHIHCTLLYEYYDFFLASQHPNASSPTRKLARKYALLARMWNYGIYNCLEIVRHNLEYVTMFVGTAYHILALCEPPPIFFVYLRKLTIVE